MKRFINTKNALLSLSPMDTGCSKVLSFLRKLVSAITKASLSKVVKFLALKALPMQFLFSFA